MNPREHVFGRVEWPGWLRVWQQIYNPDKSISPFTTKCEKIHNRFTQRSEIMKTTANDQQGDVLLKPITQLPPGLEVLNTNGVVQEGEATGHQHKFDMTTPSAVKLYAVPDDRPFNDKTKYVEVTTPTKFYHQEHRYFEVLPGLYYLDIVRSWDYNTNEERRVVD